MDGRVDDGSKNAQSRRTLQRWFGSKFVPLEDSSKTGSKDETVKGGSCSP